jgi:hypothetical protein
MTRAGLNVGADFEQGFEVMPVEGVAAGQVEGDDIPGMNRSGLIGGCFV